VAIENYVQLTACKAVPMDDLIRSCLRMKPHRILVGEVRGTEALTAMEAWNTGHPGGSMTIHANNAMEGLNRIVFLCQKTANPFPTHILARIVAETIHLVVYIEAGRQFPCGRKVKEVCLVKGHDGERFKIEQL
jgi:type IV secretion system protein VirB11